MKTAFAYTPYGLLTGTAGEDGGAYPFRFAGGVGAMSDPEGTIYMRARHYHPGQRQFLSPDLIEGSLARPQSLNRYGYVEGMALGGVDPSGLFFEGDKVVWKKRQYSKCIDKYYSIRDRNRPMVSGTCVREWEGYQTALKNNRKTDSTEDNRAVKLIITIVKQAYSSLVGEVVGRVDPTGGVAATGITDKNTIVSGTSGAMIILGPKERQCHRDRTFDPTIDCTDLERKAANAHDLQHKGASFFLDE
ncbi:MAG: hypothetical protein D3916_18555 [Candidatus Electrothrix sp. MAN1_4]|nr:hypothetical protein [Candidatus Electrothrix sp. MAN1_4]